MPKNPPMEPGDAPLPPTRRDRQRDALNNLIRLVKECAASETQVEQVLVSAQDRAAKELNRALSACNEKYQALEQAVSDTFARRTMETDRQFEFARDELNAKSKNKRQQLAHEHDKTAEDLKTKLEQAIWLADSVLEAAEIRVKQEYQHAKEQAENAAKALDDLEDRAKTTLINLGQPLPAAPAEPPANALAGNPAEEFEKQRQIAEKQLAELDGLSIPRMVAGGKLYVFGVLICGAAIAAPQVIAQTLQPQWVALGAFAVISIGATAAAGVYLNLTAKKQVATAFIPMVTALAAGRKAVAAMIEQADQRRVAEQEAAVAMRKREVQKAKDAINPLIEQSQKKRDQLILTVRNEMAKRISDLEKQRDAARAAAEQWQKEILPKVQKRHQRHLAAAHDRHDTAQFNTQCVYEKTRAELERKWADGLSAIRAPMEDGSRAVSDWSPEHWAKWTPSRTFTETVRFGEFEVDLKKIVEQAAPGAAFTLPLPDAFSLPALLVFPRQSSLLIHSDPAGRTDALNSLKLVMVRLLTCLPPGRVRFTIIDPVGLGQNFSGFMHLGDFDEALVGPRIWTSNDHIEQRLADLTEHMETVIQKYLRNEFETIDEYNAQAGELAEPYRFLVIADFPEKFEADALRRLASIASTGARCGVYTLVFRDTRLPIPSGSHFADVESHGVNLIHQKDKFIWKDEIFKQFPLHLDAPPPEESLTQILQVVGKAAKEAARVEVPFENITPKSHQVWSRNSAGDLEVPVGRAGATRLQYVRLGKGVAQHGLIAGKTGSGKSSLLNALITNAALWYSPDQLVLYLIDFKKGVEFKTYATHNLPHAKAIAVESDREFGLSVLQRIDGELTRRGEMYRKKGVQDLAAYRETDGAEVMPRILLIIDEFQEFFSEDDKLSQEASQLLDRLVRQGRAFGIHVFLGSQTLAGSSGLSRSTIGQMGVRVALQCSEADSQLILGDNNSAARLLSRPGEAIYNDAGGLVEGNSPFQVAWLPDETRERMLKVVQERAAKDLGNWEPPIIFEGNSAAPIAKNVQLVNLLDSPTWPAPPAAPAAWLGDPVAIKAPTAVAFRRQSGANLLMIGQQEEAAMAMMASVLASLASQYPPGGVKFIIFDGSAVDSPLNQVLPKVKDVLPQEVKLVDFRAAPEAIDELAAELARRQAVEPTASGRAGEEIFLLVYGIQRYRMLRKQEESFSFSASDEPKKADPGKEFADLLREGPGLGIHIIGWADTPASIDRTLERTAMREFDYRVLFQMSANDSSNLIDSPAANKLGSHRALVYSEEQGTMEKFRPYALPDKEWLEKVKTSLAAKRDGAT
jgi:DNA segregation ATPase FtsK/SpoIIIE, S-DNA-T family